MEGNEPNLAATKCAHMYESRSSMDHWLLAAVATLP